jgi:7-cyano-7-deazaguanine synthase
MSNSKRKAVILLSGGLDSTATIAIAEEQGFDVFGLTANYGQRHRKKSNLRSK